MDDAQLDAMMDIDQNIRQLVTELNEFLGIVTFGSCGGHQEGTLISQRPVGEFEVNFYVYPLHGGWRSLELIASVVSESIEHGKLTLTIWSMGGGTSVCFELAGCDNADPDLLARNLLVARAEYDDDYSVM